jgi:zinc transport system permease protein
MSSFLTDLLHYPFLQYALLAGVLVSVACGIVGSYVTVRRNVSIAGAIAHSTLGGMGAALYLQREHGWTFLSPLHGATVAALLAAVIIAWLTLYGRQREDTVLGAVWAIGMAVGILFISKTSGYSQDLMSYLFGNILMVRREDLWLIALLDVVVVTVSLLYYNKFQAICFDAEFAKLRGVRTGVYHTLLICLTALTVVLLVQVVGMVMVIALLSLPAATAARFSKRLWQMMIWATLLSMLCTVGGLWVSYKPDLPAGATIILLAGALYVAVLSVAAVRRKIRQKG